MRIFRISVRRFQNWDGRRRGLGRRPLEQPRQAAHLWLAALFLRNARNIDPCQYRPHTGYARLRGRRCAGRHPLETQDAYSLASGWDRESSPYARTFGDQRLTAFWRTLGRFFDSKTPTFLKVVAETIDETSPQVDKTG